MADELQQAFDYFNERLFHGVLPPCLITLQRERATFGYFHAKRFVSADGRAFTHELALNPSYFVARTLKATLSTLCHELVHLQQEICGTPGRRGYHNAEWATFMKCIGLMPSDTGAPGGRETGERVSHYIVDGGLFDVAADDLLNDQFVLSWIDRYATAVPVGMRVPENYRAKEIPNTTAPQIPDPANDGDVGPLQASSQLTSLAASELLDEIDPRDMPEVAYRGTAQLIKWPSDARNGSRRTKYKCPGCKAQVWGKPKLDIRCGHCGGRQYEVETDVHAYGARRTAELKN
ncbi:SprT-like domain-containing protein [Rhodanobacter denitrificans]|nr:SprT-like domain-containing protein [Rhodanobacter denitrificans]UJJ53014.1 SprT-like domain-containing protein [Rhodanobacter denitrificans]